jgi:hypothetical protein
VAIQSGLDCALLLAGKAALPFPDELFVLFLSRSSSLEDLFRGVLIADYFQFPFGFN